MPAPTVYDPAKNILTWGSHLATGLTGDGFSTEPQTEGNSGVSDLTGAQVEITVDPNRLSMVKVTLLATSPSNSYFSQQYELGRRLGRPVVQPLLIKDLNGYLTESAAYCWISKPPTVSRGKEAAPVEWQLMAQMETREISGGI